MILINLALTYVLQFVVLAFHEVGHGVAARLTGSKVLSIRIGYGKELFRLLIREVRFVVCAFPFMGLTFSILTLDTWMRTRVWIRVFGGPAVQILTLFIIYLLFPSKLDPRTIIPSMFLRLEPISAFAAANLLVLVISLIPSKVMRPTGPVSTDGYKLLVIPFTKRAHLDVIQKAAPRLEAAHLLQYGHTEEALIILNALLTEFPDDDALKHDIAVANMRYGRFEEALSTFTKLLTSSTFQKREAQVLLKNNIASVVSVLNRTDLFEQAEQYSREAVAFNPKMMYFTGTRGAVLVRLGRVNEGIDHLKKAFRQHSVGDDRAAEACFIALGESKRGNYKSTRKWLDRASHESPNLPLIRMIEKEIFSDGAV